MGQFIDVHPISNASVFISAYAKISFHFSIKPKFFYFKYTFFKILYIRLSILLYILLEYNFSLFFFNYFLFFSHKTTIMAPFSVSKCLIWFNFLNYTNKLWTFGIGCGRVANRYFALYDLSYTHIVPYIRFSFLSFHFYFTYFSWCYYAHQMYCHSNVIYFPICKCMGLTYLQQVNY